MIEKIGNDWRDMIIVAKLNEIIDTLNNCYAKVRDLPPKSSLEVGSECKKCGGKGVIWLDSQLGMPCPICNVGKVAQNELRITFDKSALKDICKMLDVPYSEQIKGFTKWGVIVDPKEIKSLEEKLKAMSHSAQFKRVEMLEEKLKQAEDEKSFFIKQSNDLSSQKADLQRILAKAEEMIKDLRMDKEALTTANKDKYEKLARAEAELKLYPRSAVIEMGERLAKAEKTLRKIEIETRPNGCLADRAVNDIATNYFEKGSKDELSTH
jgi:hypothetical protein